MIRIKEAKLSDLKDMDGKENLLGGPSFSLSALEMFMKEPDFAVLTGGGAGMVLYHEGRGGKSRGLLLVGDALPELLQAAEDSARKAGAMKVTMEADPSGPIVGALETNGYRRARSVANYFGKDRPAAFMEKIL
jgi:hypothetical protein